MNCKVKTFLRLDYKNLMFCLAKIFLKFNFLRFYFVFLKKSSNIAAYLERINKYIVKY